MPDRAVIWLPAILFYPVRGGRMTSGRQSGVADSRSQQCCVTVVLTCQVTPPGASHSDQNHCEALPVVPHHARRSHDNRAPTVPSCGASITAEGRGSLFCSYCGAKLRIKTGASGNPVAVLDGIKEDTSLMAKRSALGHVEEELSRVEEEREEVARNCEAKRAELDEARDPGCVGFVPLGLLMVGIVLVIQFLYGRIVQGVIGLLVLGVVAAMYVAWNRYDAVTEGKRAALKSDAARAVAEVDAKIATLRERAEALRGEIDRSISEM